MLPTAHLTPAIRLCREDGSTANIAPTRTKLFKLIPKCTYLPNGRKTERPQEGDQRAHRQVHRKRADRAAQQRLPRRGAQARLEQRDAGHL